MMKLCKCQKHMPVGVRRGQWHNEERLDKIIAVAKRLLRLVLVLVTVHVNGLIVDHIRWLFGRRLAPIIIITLSQGGHCLACETLHVTGSWVRRENLWRLVETHLWPLDQAPKRRWEPSQTARVAWNPRPKFAAQGSKIMHTRTPV